MTGFNDSNETIRVYISNSYGEGFAGHKEVESGTTLGELSNQECGGANPDLFMIRHNGSKDPSSSTVLSNEDTVSFTPTKIKGAA